MSILKTNAFCVLLGLCGISSFAQQASPVNEPDYNKPKLFADLPQRMHIDVPQLETLFNMPVGQVISVPLTVNSYYQGIIISKSEVTDVIVTSVTIKSSNRVGSVFTFTRLRRDDGSFFYIGRVISHKHGDAYEVVEEKGNYFLEKRSLYDLFNE